MTSCSTLTETNTITFEDIAKLSYQDVPYHYRNIVNQLKGYVDKEDAETDEEIDLHKKSLELVAPYPSKYPCLRCAREADKDDPYTRYLEKVPLGFVPYYCRKCSLHFTMTFTETV